MDEKREVFHELEDELQRAKTISDEMFKTYKERDLDFDWHKEKADQLVERWQNVHVQIDNRLVAFSFSFSSDLISLFWVKSKYLRLSTPSLGFSRQEHWSGLPLPSPMHESEK